MTAYLCSFDDRRQSGLRCHVASGDDEPKQGDRLFENSFKLWWAVPTLLLLTGCGGNSPKAGGAGAATEKELPFKGVSLRLVVAGDHRLAEAIGRLKGEWRATTGAELEVDEMPEAELIEGQLPAADAVVCPAYNLGILVEEDRVRPLPASELSSAEVAWEEIFEADKAHDASWAETTYGFSFGSPTLVCCYRKDLLEKLGQEPPTTWPEYEKLAALLADRKNLGEAAPAADAPWSGTIEPLATGWAGLTLLVRAACYAKHRNHFSTLFNMESMDPLIAGRPFVRALDELIAAKEFMPNEASEASPEQAHDALLAGRCGMALAWTSPAFDQDTAGQTHAPQASDSATQVDIGFAILPGSPQAFNPKTNQWEDRRNEESPHVTLVGASGRLGAVTKTSSHPDAAFRLLGWLSGPQWSERVSTATSQATLFRRSQVKSAQQWADPRLEAPSASEYANTVERALGSAEFFGAPRNAGRERYLAALDEAVRSAVSGKATSQAALDAAADEWRKITAELGLDKQRAAYRRSLGLR
jgi:multiple sugar transport system substrate-binding protein